MLFDKCLPTSHISKGLIIPKTHAHGTHKVPPWVGVNIGN
jgi:hypothetical protein